MAEEKAPGKEPQAIQVKLTRIELPQGSTVQELTSYANVVNVGHTPWEFHLDFCLLEAYEGTGGPIARNELVHRIHISPHLIKGLIGALQANVARYEADFNIVLPERPAGRAWVPAQEA